MVKFSLFFCVLFCLLDFILDLTDGLVVVRPEQKTCVIGAGIAGLAAARYLQEYGVENFTVYEATRHIGGTWRFDPHVGTDEDGLPVFTHMYKNLRTNTPRQTMEFAGFSFPDDTPSYPSATCYYKYLKSFTKYFGLLKYIQFRSYVTSVKRDNDRWSLTYTNTEQRTNHTEFCDFVLVANGPLNEPKWPEFNGLDKFKGKVIHSHDYKDPEDYRNKSILLVGAGPSGLDLASHLAPVTKKLVHSHHLFYNVPNFPKHYIGKPDIVMFNETGAIFNDDSFEEFEEVIFCTGFELSHPFLDETCGVTLSNKFILPLYQQMVNIRYPTMLFIGKAKAIITRLLDAQAEYAAALIYGKFELPSHSEMLKSWTTNMYQLHSEGKKIVDVNLIGKKQDQYFANLTQEAGIARVPPVLSVVRDYNAQIRLEDLLNYRDYDYNITDPYHYVRFYNPRNETCDIKDE